MVGHSRDDSGDALVQQRHGCGAVDETGKGLYQLLPKTWLQGSEGAKLLAEREGKWLKTQIHNTRINIQHEGLGP